MVTDESKINTNSPKQTSFMRKRAVQEDVVQKSFQKWSIIHYCNPNIAQFTSIHTDFIYIKAINSNNETIEHSCGHR